MHTAVVASGVVAAGLLAAPPASADAYVRWTYDSRPAGMPATADPARTLDSARATVRKHSGEARVEATVRLAATPQASDDEVHLVLGSVDDTGACVPDADVSAPVDDSATVDIDAAVPSLIQDHPCSYVTVVDPASSTALDRLDGWNDGVVIVDPALPLTVRSGGHHRLPVDRWSYVVVGVELPEHASRLRLTGEHTPGLRARPVVARDLDAGHYRFRLPVQLGVHRRQWLTVHGHAVGPRPGHSTVRIRVVPR
ncbi:hypothetical protein [Nocardioides aquiterrae]